MRTARLNTTRFHQLESATDHLGFDALEADAAADLLAEFDYEVYDAAEFELAALPLAEFEAAITPAGAETEAWAPVAALPLAGQGEAAELFEFGEVA